MSEELSHALWSFYHEWLSGIADEQSERENDMANAFYALMVKYEPAREES